jgi:hypothetical protein
MKANAINLGLIRCCHKDTKSFCLTCASKPIEFDRLKIKMIFKFSTQSLILLKIYAMP